MVAWEVFEKVLGRFGKGFGKVLDKILAVSSVSGNCLVVPNAFQKVLF